MHTNSLPDGWVRDVDGYGKPYYWHVASGITQREHPLSSAVQGDEDYATALCDSVVEENNEEFQQSTIQRFFVTSLGWRPLNLADLAADQVSRSIQRCIENLACDKSAINIADSVASWGGDGKKICIEIDCERGEIVIRDAMAVQAFLFEEGQVGKALITHHLQSIRAWGIGTDGDRDFAYVVRDPMSPVGSPVFQCHVLRCEDGDASRIASAIYDGCNNTSTNNNKVEPVPENVSNNSHNSEEIHQPEENDGSVPPRFDVTALSFALPQPADEPRKIILCHFIGSAEADGPIGMKVLNDAVARALQRHPVERWHFAAVMISPSAVVVRDASEAHHSVDNKDRPLLDCRVRYLSFVGIASDDVRVCAFITHAADDTFFAHVFHCEPSAGALSKAIEAACELRFQKCLDSRQSTGPKPGSSMPNSASESMLSAYSSKMSTFATSFAKRFAGFVTSSGQAVINSSRKQPAAENAPLPAVRNRAPNSRLPSLVLPSALSNFAQRVGWSSNSSPSHNTNNNTPIRQTRNEYDSLIAH